MSLYRVSVQSKDVRTVLRFRSCLKGMQRKGAGGFPWSRESLISLLCSFHFAVPPPSFNKQFLYFLCPNFLPSVFGLSMSVGRLDTGGGKND